MEVPDPRTVNRRGVADIAESDSGTCGVSAVHRLTARLPSRRNGLSPRLRNLQISHLQLARQVHEKIFFIRRKPSFCLFVERVEHIDEFSRRLRVHNRLSRARVRVRTQHHRRIASQHADQILKRRGGLRRFGRWPWIGRYRGTFLRLCFGGDRKSTRLNSSHGYISYAVFCLKKKKKN